MKTMVAIRIPLGQDGLEAMDSTARSLLPEGQIVEGAYECRLKKSSQKLKDLLDALLSAGVTYTLQEVRSFRPREILEAEALRVLPSFSLTTVDKDAESEAFEGGCPGCARGAEQIRELTVSPATSQRDGISTTTTGHLLVNDHVARAMITQSISGCLLRGTRDRAGVAPDVFQILPMHTLPPLKTPPTRLEEHAGGACDSCGVATRIIPSLIYCDAQENELLDLNVTDEEVSGPGRVGREIIISQRLWRLLYRCGVRHIAVEPVVLI